MTARVHPLFFTEQSYRIGAHEVVVLPHARVASVDSHARIVINLRAIGEQINRALHFAKWRRAVGLFLAVVGRLHFAAAVGDVGRII